MQIDMYEYNGHVFEVRPCFGGFSASIWRGDEQNQCKELGLWKTAAEAIASCCEWIDQQMSHKMNGKAPKGKVAGVDSKLWNHT